MMIFFCAIHLIAAEFIPAQRPKGDILLFRAGRTTTSLQAASLSQGSNLGAGDEESAGTPGSTAVGLHETNKKGNHEVPRQNPSIFSGLQKQTAVFSWENLNLDIKTPEGTRHILDQVDGWVKPGTLTALMVSSASYTSLR